MALTAAERTKRYRERIKNDPAKLTDYKKIKVLKYCKQFHLFKVLAIASL